MGDELPDHADGPPPYRVYGQDRLAAWKVDPHEAWVELEVELWVSGLYYDPWQHPSVPSGPPTARDGEVRSAVVPGTRVGISYGIWAKSRSVRLLEVADLP